jgi:hypothetical protein
LLFLCLPLLQEREIKEVLLTLIVDFAFKPLIFFAKTKATVHRYYSHENMERTVFFMIRHCEAGIERAEAIFFGFSFIGEEIVRVFKSFQPELIFS